MAVNTFLATVGPVCTGGTNQKGHEGDMEIMSWSHACHQPTSPVRSHAGGGTIEKAAHANFTITKQLDSATDDLLKICWTGKHIDKVTLSAYRSTGDETMTLAYVVIEMESVIVADYSISGGQGEFPTEVISFAYGKITYTYTGQDRSKGTIGSAQPVYHDLRTHEVG